LFPEVVEFVMDLGVELEDSITDMLAINSDDHPVVSTSYNCVHIHLQLLSLISKV
jgi:hypothetical protein